MEISSNAKSSGISHCKFISVPVEGGWVGASAQLHQLVSGRGVKQADERSFARGRGHHAAWLVQCHAGDLTLVGVDGEGGG